MINHNKTDESFVALSVPVPPMLEYALCYGGDNRYVAIWWDMGPDTVLHSDGVCGGTGDPYGWLAFSQHALVSPTLSKLDYIDFNLDPEKEAVGRLLLDRQKRQLFFGVRELIMGFLRRGNDIPDQDAPPICVTSEQLNDVIQLRNTYGDELQRRSLMDYYLDVKGLLVWLDTQGEQKGQEVPYVKDSD